MASEEAETIDETPWKNLLSFQVDPAVASGPVLTTVTDMCGFFLVLGLATLALPWLV